MTAWHGHRRCDGCDGRDGLEGRENVNRDGTVGLKMYQFLVGDPTFDAFLFVKSSGFFSGFGVWFRLGQAET